MPNAHEQLVGTMRDYLGPAAERFVDRQIVHELSKKPDELTSDDIPKLIQPIEEWFFGFSGDKNLTVAVVARIKRLTEEGLVLAR